MAKLNKKWMALGIAGALALSGGCILFSIFTSPIKDLQNDIQKESRILAEEKSLIANKPSFEKEWEEKKNFFSPGVESEAVLNNWVKDLLAAAQSQALTLEKLEPAGVKADAGVKKLAVFISFQGDIRKLAGFVYQLMEKDPLARIESIDVRLEEGAKTLIFELMLGKIVP